jgi:hypothetical protein
MQKNKHLELATSQKFMVYVSSIEPQPDNWDDPGNWQNYDHRIVIKNIDFSDEVLIGFAMLEKIQEGQFEIEGEKWCKQIRKLFSKKNIQNLAKNHKKIEEFLEDLLREVYDACMSYYNSCIDEDEDEEVNEEAVSEWIWQDGGKGWGKYHH